MGFINFNSREPRENSPNNKKTQQLLKATSFLETQVLWIINLLPRLQLQEHQTLRFHISSISIQSRDNQRIKYQFCFHTSSVSTQSRENQRIENQRSNHITSNQYKHCIHKFNSTKHISSEISCLQIDMSSGTFLPLISLLKFKSTNQPMIKKKKKKSCIKIFCCKRHLYKTCHLQLFKGDHRAQHPQAVDGIS